MYQTLVDLIEADPQALATPEGHGPSFLRPPAPNTRRMVASPLMQWVDFAAAEQRNRCVIAPETSHAARKPAP